MCERSIQLIEELQKTVNGLVLAQAVTNEKLVTRDEHRKFVKKTIDDGFESVHALLKIQGDTIKAQGKEIDTNTSYRLKATGAFAIIATVIGYLANKVL